MGLPAVAMIGMGLLLAGCGDQAASGSTTTQDAAKQQFLADRGANGTPGAVTGTPGANGFAGRAPGVFGAIDKIDGNNITIKSQADGTETVVQLGTGATIRTQGEAQASDIKEGETVTATGTKNGDTLEAQVVQIGNGGPGGFGGFGGAGGGPGAGAGGGAGRFNGTPGAGRNGGRFNGTPGAGRNGGGFFGNGTPGPNAQGTPGVQRDFFTGTVAKVDGSNVTLNMANSTTGTFSISSTTRLQKETDMQATDLKVGDNVVATGQQNGNVFEATGLQVVTGNGGGFFGGGAGGPGGLQGQETPTP
jgi:preprotein translocase subunit YajC